MTKVDTVNIAGNEVDIVGFVTIGDTEYPIVDFPIITIKDED